MAVAKVFYTRDLLGGYLNKEIVAEDYVYTVELEAEDPDEVFHILNQDDRTHNKQMRSMSVGDIVIIKGKAYYCAPLGWKKVPKRVKLSLELNAMSEAPKNVTE